MLLGAAVVVVAGEVVLFAAAVVVVGAAVVVVSVPVATLLLLARWGRKTPGILAHCSESVVRSIRHPAPTIAGALCGTADRRRHLLAL